MNTSSNAVSNTESTAFSMEQVSTLEANCFASSQEFSHFMEPEVSLLHSQLPPSVPIPSQVDPIHTARSDILNIYINIIQKFTPGSPQ